MNDQHEQTQFPPDRPRFLRSGEVAAAARVNVQTLRYYERRGLLPRPERSVSGQRQYPVHVVTLLRMIKNARHLGFSLDEITGLIAGDRDLDAIPAIAARKLAETDAEIARLTLIRQALALTASAA
jgi:DNA-binding transcriptional MerR regulator